MGHSVQNPQADLSSGGHTEVHDCEKGGGRPVLQIGRRQEPGQTEVRGGGKDGYKTEWVGGRGNIWT